MIVVFGWYHQSSSTAIENSVRCTFDCIIKRRCRAVTIWKNDSRSKRNSLNENWPKIVIVSLQTNCGGVGLNSTFQRITEVEVCCVTVAVHRKRETRCVDHLLLIQLIYEWRTGIVIRIWLWQANNWARTSGFWRYLFSIVWEKLKVNNTVVLFNANSISPNLAIQLCRTISPFNILRNKCSERWRWIKTISTAMSLVSRIVNFFTTPYITYGTTSTITSRHHRPTCTCINPDWNRHALPLNCDINHKFRIHTVTIIAGQFFVLFISLVWAVSKKIGLVAVKKLSGGWGEPEDGTWGVSGGHLYILVSERHHLIYSFTKYKWNADCWILSWSTFSFATDSD